MNHLLRIVLATTLAAGPVVSGFCLSGCTAEAAPGPEEACACCCDAQGASDAPAFQNEDCCQEITVPFSVPGSVNTATSQVPGTSPAPVGDLDARCAPPRFAGSGNVPPVDHETSLAASPLYIRNASLLI